MRNQFRAAVLAVVLSGAILGCEPTTGPEPMGSATDGAIVAGPVTPTLKSGSPRAHDIVQVSDGYSQIAGWCDETSGTVLVEVGGSGTLTHAGRFETLQFNCLSLATGAITGGQGVVEAANGDEIWLTYEGRVVPGVVPQTLELYYDLSGGTGRFAAAAGELAIIVVYTSESTWTSRGSGWMSYAASDRAGSPGR